MKIKKLNDVTIVMPAYNSEKTIRRSLESIYLYAKGVKLILVNDGSTDGTKKIALEYLNKIDLQIIDQNNGGVSSARNNGISKVKTEYIMFVDSDDEIAEGFDKKLEDSMKTHADLYVFGHKYIKNAIKYKKIPKKFAQTDIVTFFSSKKVSDYSIFLQYPWGKLFSTSLISENKLTFNITYTHGEDTLFLFEYLKYVRDIKFVDKIIYKYYHYENSLSRNVSTEVYEKYDYINNKLLELFEILNLDNNLNKLYELRVRRQTLNLISVITNNLNTTASEKEKLLIKIFKKINVKKSFMNKKDLSFIENIFRNSIIKEKTTVIFIIMKLKKIIKG